MEKLYFPFIMREITNPEGMRRNGIEEMMNLGPNDSPPIGSYHAEYGSRIPRNSVRNSRASLSTLDLRAIFHIPSAPRTSIGEKRNKPRTGLNKRRVTPRCIG